MRNPSYEDVKIVDGIKMGGRARTVCINQLFDAHQGFVFMMMKRKGLSLEDAKDAYSDSIIKVAEQIENNKFRAEGKISTYLFSIFSNRCSDVLRKKTSYQTEPLDVVAGVEDDGRSGLDNLISKEQFEAVEYLLDQLSPKCKNILLDWGYYGYSMAEIAVRSDLKNAESAVSQKHKCFQKLKEKIKESLATISH